MPRQPRLRGPDMWFHVFNRGADRQDLFHDDADFTNFESLLAEAVFKFGLEIHGFALMTNHFHCLVHCTDDVLSESFHRIATVYAGRYNRRYQRTGPLFEGRFRSVPVTSDEQLLATSRYIHRNPEAIVGERALAAYRWSSYAAYLGTRPTPSWLTSDFVLVQFSRDPARYQAFVEDGCPCVLEPPITEVEVNRHADEVEVAVARVAGVDVATLHRSRRHMLNEPRLAAILLIHERRLASSAEIADRFEMHAASTARAAARRARALRVSDPAFCRLVERAEDELRGCGRAE